MRFTARQTQPPDPASLFITHSTSRETKSPPLRSPDASRDDRGRATRPSEVRHGKNARDRCGRTDTGKGRRQHRLRRARRRDQSALLRAEAARLDQAHTGAARRRCLPHGGGLYPRQGRQYRRLHRHLGSGRHRHDHRTLFGDRGFHSDPLHHRAGAARAALQGRFSGDRYRFDRKTGDEMGGHRARARPGAAGVQPGLSHHALGPSGAGADRSAARRATRRNRIRRYDLFAAAGLQAVGDARAGRERRWRCSTPPSGR